MTDDFDRLIETSLRRDLSGRGSAPPGLRPRYLGAGVAGASAAGMLASVPMKVGIGLAAVSLAGGGVAIKAVATGSANPLVWGQQVQQQVTTCKAGLAPGDHGIGSCVSNFAQQQGQQERDQHAGKGQSTGAAGHPTPQAGHPTPAAAPGTPAAHPTAPAHPTSASGKNGHP